jgi:hypothetical protein
MRSQMKIGAMVALLVLTTTSERTKAEAVPAYDQSAMTRRGYFYVGGSYVGDPGKKVMHGQAYVEVLTPRAPAIPSRSY